VGLLNHTAIRIRYSDAAIEFLSQRFGAIELALAVTVILLSTRQ
jgi:hypothetical protein